MNMDTTVHIIWSVNYNPFHRATKTLFRISKRNLWSSFPTLYRKTFLIHGNSKSTHRTKENPPTFSTVYTFPIVDFPSADFLRFSTIPAGTRYTFAPFWGLGRKTNNCGARFNRTNLCREVFRGVLFFSVSTVPWFPVKSPRKKQTW